MAGLQVFIVLASIFTAVSGSHMQGGTVSFKATEKTQTGWLVDLKYKSSFIDAYGDSFYWGCYSGDCGYEINRWIQPVENRTSFPSRWYQSEGHIRRRVDNDKPFQLWESSCCWVSNVYYDGSWQMTAIVDLGMRSDTQRPNSSPVTNIIPIIRIPRNCDATINLLGHDPDGDHVRCRYAYYNGECGVCFWNFYVDEDQCTMSIPSVKSTGSYVIELILEDFPKKDIYLTYKDGTRVYKYRTYNRKSREIPKDSQKYYWYYTTLSDMDETFPQTTESVTDIRTTQTDTTEGWHGYTTGIYEAVTEETTSDLLTSIETTSHDHTVDVTSIDPFLDITTVHYQSEEETTIESLTDMTTIHPTTEEPTTDKTTPHDYKTDAITDLPTTRPSTFGETTQQHILTKDVTFPYETTGWDFYPFTNSYLYMDSLSRISLQFIVEVTNPAPSCTLGDYRPKFVSPTPSQGERLMANAGRVFQLHLSAQAAYESVSDFKVSGPPGISKSFTHKSRSTTRSMVAEWRPSENDVGDHVPFCFVAETSNGYQSEMRCVVVVVGPGSLGNTDLTCHDNTMTLIVAKSSDHELYENQFRLNDPKCLVSSNSTHLIASVAYNSCGTETEETEHNIVFKNQATSIRDNSSVITRKHGVSIPFNCSFPKKTRVSASFRAHKSDYVFSEAGFGNFTYKFQFYTDDLFEEVESEYPLEVTLQELLFMEIQVSSSVPNVQLFVESCKATPHDNPNDPTFYDIVQNGCIMDETFVVYSSTRTQYRFAMEAFAFIADYSEVYISCTVILCKLGEPGTRCTQGCITKSSGDSHRQRRSLSSESQQHYISQGPITMKRQSPNNTDLGGSPSLNVNTLVISLSGVAIVALLGFTVNTYMRRSRVSGYELLKTQEI